MMDYCRLLLCASALALSEGAVIESLNQDVIDPGQHHYLAIPDKHEKVEMIILYEPYCHGCIILHTKVLPGVLQKLGPYLDYKPYPFGCARMWEHDGKWTFRCDRDDDCHATKLHACAIDKLYNATNAEPYNSCMMSKKWGGEGSTDMDAINCGKEMKISAQPIIDCANSQKGIDLLVYYGKETIKIIGDGPYCWIPHLLLNGKEFHEHYDKLIQVICAAFTNPPPVCKE